MYTLATEAEIISPLVLKKTGKDVETARFVLQTAQE
jgi:hypothetical protein